MAVHGLRARPVGAQRLLLKDHAVTAKDLMVQPNPPRFLREGDTLEFTVKVSNQSDTAADRHGAAHVHRRLERAAVDDCRSAGSCIRQRRTAAANTEQDFDIPAKESRSFSWRITVPDGCGFLTYKAVAAVRRRLRRRGRRCAGAVAAHSGHRIAAAADPRPGDEEVRVHQTAQVRQFEHASEPKPDRADGLESRVVRRDGAAVPDGVSARMSASRPSTGFTPTRWPAHRRPAIRRSIASSTNGATRPALDSPLEKNQDLKAVMLEETPWLRQAQTESQARRNVGILFDDNRLNDEIRRDAAEAGRDAAGRTAPGRGSPAAAATITSRSTSPPASAGCGTSAWTSMSPPPSARSPGSMPG